MTIDFQRLRKNMVIRVYDSEQALELLSAFVEAKWRWGGGNRIFQLPLDLLEDIRGICVEDCENRILTYWLSSDVSTMFGVETDIVDFYDVIFDDEVPEDLPDIDLNEFLG